MLYVYRPTNSTGARELAEGITLAGTLARRTKGAALRTLQNGDAVVCWGAHFVATPGTKVLNNVAPISKFLEAQRLAAANVPTIQVSQNRPPARAAQAAVRPARGMFRSAFGATAEFNEIQARDLQAQLTAYLNAPLPPAAPAVAAETWLPRRNNHVGGSDLLAAPAQPDFYSKKENIVEEYRVHMFKGKSIRAGKKVQRPARPDGSAPHPWIRSFDAGWVIQYDGFESTKAMRDIGARALETLGLDFGAIDIGKKADGTLIVLEVNRAPGIENNTITAYARHIIAWLTNREVMQQA